MNSEELMAKIAEAFQDVEYPGDHCLTRSTEGAEPRDLEEDFKGKADWRSLDSDFLDSAPRGMKSALSFFSDEAFQFYLPAYLLADLKDELSEVDVVFQLIYGLYDELREEPVNPRRYGNLTLFESSSERFDGFSKRQASAIIAFLEFKMTTSSYWRTTGKPKIDQAIRNYWQKREQSGR